MVVAQRAARQPNRGADRARATLSRRSPASANSNSPVLAKSPWPMPKPRSRAGSVPWPKMNFQPKSKSNCSRGASAARLQANQPERHTAASCDLRPRRTRNKRGRRKRQSGIQQITTRNQAWKPSFRDLESRCTRPRAGCSEQNANYKTGGVWL